MEPDSTPESTNPETTTPPASESAAGPEVLKDKALDSSTPVAVQSASQMQSQNKRKFFSKKSLLISGLAALLLLGGGAAYAFAVYLPNQPTNVFKTGMDRSGDNLNKLINKLTEKDELKKFENSQISGTLSYTGTGGSFNGDLTMKLNRSKLDGTINVNFKPDGQAEKKLTLDMLAEVMKNKRLPDTYFRVTGLKSLGISPEFSALVDPYDGKWITIGSDYLESLYAKSGIKVPKNQQNISSDDVASMVRVVSSTTSEYFLTSDKNKAVLEEKAFVGKETVDGIRTYHYTVTSNEAHAIDYCKALLDRVYSQPAYKKLGNLDDAGVADAKKDIPTTCEKAMKQDKKDTTMDLWVDAKYKLIHKLRIHDDQDVQNYVDIGQTYTGGDNISFFVVMHSDAQKTDGKFTVDLDSKTYTTTGTFTLDSTASETMHVKVTFTAKPYDKDFTITKPAGAISIQEIMKKFGL